jgi:hypothetical protein
MAAPPADIRPLAAFAAQRVAVAPAQRLRLADSVAWGGQVSSPREYLGALDSAFSAALTARGMGTAWALPADVVRAAKRNAVYAADPHALAVGALVPRRTPPVDVTEPLATQLRTLVALADARYAFVPVELRFEKGPGAGRAVVHVALVDARSAEVTWSGDVAGDTASTLSPALAASAAVKVADLIVAP